MCPELRPQVKGSSLTRTIPFFFFLTIPIIIEPFVNGGWTIKCLCIHNSSFLYYIVCSVFLHFTSLIFFFTVS